MARVTSKLQVTVPKVVADQFGIRPGTDITWTPAGDSIRVVVTRTTASGSASASASAAALAALPDDRLALFDRATARQKARDRRAPRGTAVSTRGWTRDSLYRDDRAR
jgi:bifunctional DNA-binding transcriptional regulator/antitoxin component of YhaV-PrlF toxin-antitoxin module